jgi:hypothetical protein
MSRWYQFVLYYLWIAPHMILLGVAALMYIRSLHKKFPVFFTYTLYETLVFLLLFVNRNTMNVPTHQAAYRYIYLVTMVGSTALRFAIIQEIFADVFHGYPRLEKVANTSLSWVSFLLVIAGVFFVIYSAGSIADNLTAGVALLARSVYAIQVGLLVFLFLLARLFGLSWRSFTFGIALGSAVFASAELAMWALRLTEPDLHYKLLLDLLPTGGFHISVLVWLGYLFAREKIVSAAAVPLPEIDKWSGELRHS